MKYQTFDEMRTGRSEYVRVTCQDCGVQYLVNRQGAGRAMRCRECDRIERNRRDRIEYAKKTNARPHEMPTGITALIIHIIGQAVEDARHGSRDARLWLDTDGRDWLTIMGYDCSVDRIVKLGIAEVPA